MYYIILGKENYYIAENADLDDIEDIEKDNIVIKIQSGSFGCECCDGYLRFHERKNGKWLEMDYN